MEFIAYAIYSPDKDAYWNRDIGKWTCFHLIAALHDTRYELVQHAEHYRLKNYEIHEFVCKRINNER